MDWWNVTKWHPVSNDIIPNDNHEYNTLLHCNRKAEKVLPNPIVDEFISTDPLPTLTIAHDDSHLQNNNVYLTFKVQD